MIQERCRYALSSFLLLATASTASPSGSAVEQFQSLQAELRQSHASNDWRSNLASATRLRQLLNDSPGSLLEVARAQVRVGDVGAALRELEVFVGMGQSADLLAMSADFSVLLKDARFATIQGRMEANRRSISLGSTAFLLSDPGLLAEDVDYDPRAKRFFMTSVREKKIISADASGASSEFAKAPDNWPMLAVKVDPSHGVVWATEVAMQGFSLAPESDWGRSAVLCYDLTSGRLLRRIEGPRPSALGDIALTAQGDVILSDGDGGGVYRVPASGDGMQRLDDGDFISPQTPAVLPDGRHVVVPDYVRGIGVLEIATKQVRWLSTEGRSALSGSDGLYFDRGRLIAVQNGTSPERVVAFTLDPSFTRIESETILEQSTGTLGDPTHGVVIGDDFYYIANSGWDVIDDHGNLKPGARPSAARIMRAPLVGGTPNAEDSARTILERYVDAWRGRQELPFDGALVVAFWVQGRGGGEYTATLTQDAAALKEGIPAQYDVGFELDIHFLRQLDRGEMSALTAMGQARSTDPIPLVPKLGPTFGHRPDAGLLFRRLSFHFWNRDWPEVVPFGESAARQVHGGNAAVLAYDQEFRSAWYQVKPGMHLNQDPKDQANDFPQLIAVTRGRLKARFDGQERTLSEGQAVFIPAGMRHELWADDGDYAELIWTAFGKGA